LAWAALSEEDIKFLVSITTTASHLLSFLRQCRMPANGTFEPFNMTPYYFISFLFIELSMKRFYSLPEETR
jgi:hypothetical protein